MNFLWIKHIFIYLETRINILSHGFSMNEIISRESHSHLPVKAIFIFSILILDWQCVYCVLGQKRGQFGGFVDK